MTPSQLPASPRRSHCEGLWVVGPLRSGRAHLWVAHGATDAVEQGREETRSNRRESSTVRPVIRAFPGDPPGVRLVSWVLRRDSLVCLPPDLCALLLADLCPEVASPRWWVTRSASSRRSCPGWRPKAGACPKRWSSATLWWASPSSPLSCPTWCSQRFYASLGGYAICWASRSTRSIKRARWSITWRRPYGILGRDLDPEVSSPPSGTAFRAEEVSRSSLMPRDCLAAAALDRLVQQGSPLALGVDLAHASHLDWRWRPLPPLTSSAGRDPRSPPLGGPERDTVGAAVPLRPPLGKDAPHASGSARLGREDHRAI